MKKTSVLILVGVFFGFIGAEAFAAKLSFNPDSAVLDVLPGEQGVAVLEVKLESEGRCAVGMAVDASSIQGNLPPGWLMPAGTNLRSSIGGVTSSQLPLRVTVPADTPAGKYSAVLKPRIILATEQMDSSDISLMVEVSSSAKCDGVLSFENVQVGPASVWAPTDKEVVIELSGNIVVSPGCEVKGFYSMESNNGPIAGSLEIEDGSFGRQFPVMLSKTGKDNEGTTYQGAVSVEDEVGNKATQVFFVTVEHDRGKNGERNPKN
ncbi:MAG: hypothetical protein R6W72_11555 [Desulfurivibrionaceae bacterium]